MTRPDVEKFAKLLFELIQFIRKKGGNRDTYILNKLMDCKELLMKEYSALDLKKFFE